MKRCDGGAPPDGGGEPGGWWAGRADHTGHSVRLGRDVLAGVAEEGPLPPG
jgi:hypothetical protein